ncbi:MAG: DUF1015 domain-containing protein [Tepidisphaerales bacterium]
MAHIRPFHAIRYARNPKDALSDMIAPPYDVLDEKGKAALQARHPHNIVTVDLPHLPPKVAGPDAAYEQANITFRSWLDAGVLIQDPKSALYPYTQTYTHHGRTFHRRGFFALVRLSAFGQGHIVPHEQTYKGPIEDRMKLMRATGVQLSPIFGLYSDPRNQVMSLLSHELGRSELSGTLDGVRNDLWAVNNADTVNQVLDLMAQKPIYIADGHHRYTTALQYQQEAAAAHGKALPENHPANWCLFVLVSMQDDGLIILPTHRLLGGLRNFDIGALTMAVVPNFDVKEAPVGGDHVAEYARSVLAKQPPHTFWLFDGRTRKLYQLTLKNHDILANIESSRSDAWRRLDVAILQRYLLDEVFQPKFGGGKELIRGYTANPDEIAEKVDGTQYQVGLLLQSTPLHALEELGKHGEVMPQKSTYFYPKLATGMVINPL